MTNINFPLFFEHLTWCIQKKINSNIINSFKNFETMTTFQSIQKISYRKIFTTNIAILIHEWVSSNIKNDVFFNHVKVVFRHFHSFTVHSPLEVGHLSKPSKLSNNIPADASEKTFSIKSSLNYIKSRHEKETTFIPFGIRFSDFSFQTATSQWTLHGFDISCFSFLNFPSPELVPMERIF